MDFRESVSFLRTPTPPEPPEQAINMIDKLRHNYATGVLSEYKDEDHEYATIGPGDWWHEEERLTFANGPFMIDAKTGSDGLRKDFIDYAAAQIIGLEPHVWPQLLIAINNGTYDAFYDKMQSVRSVINLGEAFAAWQDHCKLFPEHDKPEYHVTAAGYTPARTAYEIVEAIKERQSSDSYVVFRGRLLAGSGEYQRFNVEKPETTWEKLKDRILDDLQSSDALDEKASTLKQIRSVAAICMKAAAGLLTELPAVEPSSQETREELESLSK